MMESQLTYRLDHFQERQKISLLDFALKSRLIIITTAQKLVLQCIHEIGLPDLNCCKIDCFVLVPHM